jgi:23S rRNA (adenine2503-C2)-methyltransferase
MDFFSIVPNVLKEWLVSEGEKSFRAKQVFEWVYQKQADWSEMSSLSQGLRDKLSQAFSLNTLKLKKTTGSEDEETIKYLWELSDGLFVESVLIFSGERRTVCVSSQVGCPAKCAFCASGKNGFLRNLTTAEIVEQIVQIIRTGERVSHIVFMGMGEPLLNLDNVLQAIKIINHPECLKIGQRRITVSTVGIIDGIRTMAEAGLQSNLVFSLHAPNDHVRKKIIPTARQYPLGEILEAMDLYAHNTGRDITYEYILISGINDAPEHAEELATLVRGKRCTVNLIPYNPVEGLRLSRPDRDAILTFREILDQRRVNNTCRYTKGDKFAAACGQLALHEAASEPGLKAS